MEPDSFIIRLELLFDQLCEADFCSEFFYQKETCIGGKITSIKIYFNLTYCATSNKLYENL